MFSRFFNKAKTYISPTYPPGEIDLAASPSPDDPEQSEPTTHFETNTSAEPSSARASTQKIVTADAVKSKSKRKTRVHSPDMVTTRRNAHKDEEREGELTEENSINVYVSGNISAVGNKRGLAEDGSDEELPTHSAKKRKVVTLPLRRADGGDVALKNTRLVVEIPALKAAKEKVDEFEVGRKLDASQKHKKFGSDDEAEAEHVEVFSTAREVPVAEEDDEEESSDDGAPEVVGAQSAAREVKLQKQSAQQAIQSLQRKRKERSSQLQKKIKKPGVKVDENRIEESEAIEEAPSEDSESDSESDASVTQHLAKGNRTKFLQTVDQPIKDRKVGNKTYRVNKAGSKNLAPKSDKRARETKEDWLKGRNGKKGLGATRKPMKKAFF